MAIDKKKKILIIGLDGVDPDLLDKFISEGILPNFKRLIANGAYGKIKSSIPIITTVTWNSFITGKNPGKHGIFGFVNFKKGSYELKILNSADRKADGIWGLLNRFGKTVGIFNLPSLYPAEKIDRFMVCGMLTPNKNSRFIYPHGLQEEFLREIKDYEIDVGVVKAAYDSKDILLKNMYFLTDKRFEASAYLLNKYPCDLFVTIITETDRVQHYFLDDAVALREYFKYLDKKTGELLAQAGDDATVFIVSDHGMGAFSKYIYINRFLMDGGFLKINKRSTNYVKHSFTKKIIQVLSTFLMRMKFDVERLKKMLPQGLVNSLTYLYCYYGGIDWGKSSAYFCSGTGEGITINTKKRFPAGIVEERDYEALRDNIIKGLLGIKDPDTGERVIEAAYKREELLNGDHTQEAPDIILRLRDGYATNESVETEVVLGERPLQEMLLAEHRLEGIIIAYGKDIRQGVRIEGSSILDIAPTLLRIFGIPVPQDFDGKPLEEIFKPGVLSLSKTRPLGEAEALQKRIRELKSSGRIK
ncbi:MAG: alkaline phosphatase family protein [Candidatus Omnitrophota bacterium]